MLIKASYTSKKENRFHILMGGMAKQHCKKARGRDCYGDLYIWLIDVACLASIGFFLNQCIFNIKQLEEFIQNICHILKYSVCLGLHYHLN